MNSRRIDSLRVLYHNKVVGRLTMGTNNTCLFQYSKQWQKDGFSISPLKLPLNNDVFEAPYMPFFGNFGVFEDSMPGGYGEYMLQKELEKEGVNYYSLNPIQKLSIVGCGGMGALCYVPENRIIIPDTDMNLDEIQQEALDVLSEKTTKNAGKLYVDSGNSGGVRPKVLLRQGGKNWIVKFRHVNDPINSGVIEFMYNEAARKAGINVPNFKLFNGKYFGEERYDINSRGGRIHVVTASGLLDEGINPPKMDYKTLLALTGYVTQDHTQVEEQFRRMVFNYYAQNYDDHARNFSFMCEGGKWKLTPAYDMTHDSPLGTHATSVNYKSNPTDDDFIEVGTSTKIPKELCESIISEVRIPAEDLVRRLNEKDYSIDRKAGLKENVKEDDINVIHVHRRNGLKR